MPVASSSSREGKPDPTRRRMVVHHRPLPIGLSYWRILVVACLLIVPQPASSRVFYKFCTLSSNEIVNAKSDGENFYVEHGSGTRRLMNPDLRHSAPYARNGDGKAFSAERGRGMEEDALSSDAGEGESAVTVHRWTEQFEGSTLESVRVRKCACADGQTYSEQDYYCIMPLTTCAIPSRYMNDNLIPACLNENQKTKRARSLWPAILGAYAFLLLCIVCTTTGRGVLHFIPGKVIPGWHRRLVDRMMETDPARANVLMRNYCHRRRLELLRRRNGADGGGDDEEEEEEAAPLSLLRIPQPQVVTAQESQQEQQHDDVEEGELAPSSLALKTHIYYSASSQDDNGLDLKKKKEQQQQVSDGADRVSDFEDEVTCTICFGPIVDGSRVGTLPCDHIFHVQCLKTWLMRRNVCPLCQMRDVAAPQYGNSRYLRGHESSATDEELGGDRPDTTSATGDGSRSQAPSDRGPRPPRWLNLMNDFMAAVPNPRPLHRHSA